MNKIYITLLAIAGLATGANAQTAYDITVHLKNGNQFTYKAEDVAQVNFTEHNDEEYNILTSQYFPDEAFLTYIKENIAGGANVFTSKQAKNYRGALNIYGYSYQVSDFTGIEYFAQLDTLIISSNTIVKQINLSELKNLSCLQLYYCTALTEVQIANFDKLTHLNISATKLCNLVKNDDGTAVLNTASTGTFDIAGNKAMEHLDVSSTGNVRTINVTDCENLNYLSVASNKITSLDLTGCNKLEQLYVNNNTGLTALCIAHLKDVLTNLGVNKTGISAIDVAGFSKLKQLNIQDNTKVTSLDLTGCTALSALSAYNTAISSIDLRACNNLESVQCHNNTSLKTLLIGDKPKLYMLSAYNTGIENIELGSLPMMYYLRTNRCPELTRIDISQVNHSGANWEIRLENSAKLTEIKVWSDFDMNNPPSQMKKDATATYVYEFSE